jgi:hypothetical protein
LSRAAAARSVPDPPLQRRRPFSSRTAIIGLLTSIKRFFRKHRLALLFVSAYLFILFFPTLFLGRILSPNDIYYQYDPWASLRSVRAQNPLIHDPPVSYYTLISLLKSDPSSFHWNRYVASGIPGFGSAAAAVLSPFILIPALLMPLSLVYVGIVLTKFAVSFMLAYWWLREERLGKRGAALGALLFSAAGVYAVWWLWQSTNAAALYPAVLLMIARAFHRKSNSLALMTLIVLALLLSGFPPAVAYMAWVGASYVIYLALRLRFIPVAEILKGVAAVLLGLLLAAPSLAPLFSFLERTGYVATRQQAGYDFHYPLDHLQSFVSPFRLGDPSRHFWRGDPKLAISNNFVESTVYLGIIALILTPLGLLARPARHRWFWAATLMVLLGCMFGSHQLLKDAVGELPGFKYSPLTRLRILLPVPVAYLSAAAMAAAGSLLRSRRMLHWSLREVLVVIVGGVAVVDLALFAGHFYPYIPPSLTRLPQSPTIKYLHEQKGPFRIVAFFNYLVPNTAELGRVEDIRSQFGSEQRYRELLRRFDPEGWGGVGTVLMFNSLHANLADPVLRMANVRYLIEPIPIDIVRWRVLEKSSMNASPTGQLRIRPGTLIEREFDVDSDDLYAIDLDFRVGRKWQPNAGVTLTLIRPETGKVVFRRTWSAERLEREPKVYVPLHPHAQQGNVMLLRIQTLGMDAVIPTTSAHEAVPLLYGKVRSPIIPVTELPDGRIFENLAVLPRHWAVWSVRVLPVEELLRVPLDFGREAIMSSKPADEIVNLDKVTPELRRVGMRLLQYSGRRQVLETNSHVPFLLATSEKLTPELRITVDGQGRQPLEINGLFAAVRVAHGKHRIEIERRIGRGWWPPAFLAAVLWAAIAFFEMRTRNARASRA